MSKRTGLLVGCLTVCGVSFLIAAERSAPQPQAAPDVTAARLGGCTFNIDCDDGNPCTADTCSMDPGGAVGSGTCAHTNVPAGQPGDCDDGLFCNGKEFCPGDGAPTCWDGPDAACCFDSEFGPITACTETLAKCDGGPNDGRSCKTEGECAGAKCDHCYPTCATNADCSDGLNCNGQEFCDGGICQPGTPICGEGARCSELRCTGTPVTACNSDQDCPTGQTCTQLVPVCFTGRCCDNSPDPVCSTTRLRNPTPANPNPGLSCPTEWFPGDNGEIGSGEPCGGWSSAAGGGLGCPDYGSGIAHIAGTPPSHPVKVGPVSISPASVAAPHGPDGPLHRIGDDYAMGGSSQLLLLAMRFHGSMTPGGGAILEFWDVSGNLVADTIVNVSPALKVQRFDFSDQIVIPTSGFVTLRPSPWSSPESRLYWSSTSQVEQGANDPDVLFVNDASATSFLESASGILSFELLGNPATFFARVCMVDGECREVSEPACNEMGGALLFEHEFCAACVYGEHGEPQSACRSCQGGTEPGNVYCASQVMCDARGLGGDCLPNSALCNGSLCSNHQSVSCADDLECPSRPGICSNAETQCAVDGECPSGGICGGAGTCEEGVCQPLDLTTGACCEAGGACTDSVSESACTGGGGEFQGLGTTCESNCCEQPASGADNCEGSTVHAVPALSVNDPPYVISISGDNSAATSTQAAPDSCFGPAESPSDDRGWWEGFTLNSCARVRIDFCCSQPEHSEIWKHLYVGCPCGEVVTTGPDPNEDSPYSDGIGSPFCNDDNAWAIFGLLGPGTYYYPVRSSLPGPFGPYQLHITAQACPTAACCLPGHGCQVMDQLACEDMGGVYLGAPNRYPPIGDCTTGTCDTGSCCMGLGQCDDVDDLGDEMSEAACDAQIGSYLGGVRCHGCTCVNDPTYTCSTNADCATNAVPPGPGGSCNLAACSPSAENQPSPCPFCPFEGSGNCQTWEASFAFDAAFSDLSLGAGHRTADDFVPGPGVTEISELCVWGQHWGTDPAQNEAECGPSVLSDSFHVRVLGSSQFGLPDNFNVIGQSEAAAQKAAIRGSENSYGVETYAYHLDLATPITGLISGERYWLEVTNTVSATEPCYWLWARQKTPTGNNYSAGGTGTRGYPEDYARTGDMAFCLPGLLESPPQDIRPCCGCDATCLDGTLADCSATNRGYVTEAVGEMCGVSFTCPSQMAPANDDCDNAVPISVGNNVLSTFCTTTDGYNPVEFGFPSDSGNLGNISGDQWFTFVAHQDCTLRADMCATGDQYDSAIAVYTTGTSSCVCPLDQPTHDATFQFAADENCAFGERVGGAGWVELPMLEGQCAMIRVGYFAQLEKRGLGLLDVSCGLPICGDNAMNQVTEECDGIDDALCPGSCVPPGSPQECTCSSCDTFCGDGSLCAPWEECDWPHVENCATGICAGSTGDPYTQCRCVTVCGDQLKDGSEECDGPDDPSCGGVPGRCNPDCTCPPAVCGNNFKDSNEECDGTDNWGCACGPCRLPGDPAGECTCTCGYLAIDPAPITLDTVGKCSGNNAVCDMTLANCPSPQVCRRWTMNRFLSFYIPAWQDPCGGAGGGLASDSAVRVRLASLHHPAAPVPPSTPNFTAFEGDYRYLNSVPGALNRCCDPSSNPISCNTAVTCNSDADCVGLGSNTKCKKNLCPDSGSSSTFFRCARLGCTPEYRDWDAAFEGELVYLFGDAIVPDSTYGVAQLAPSCAGNEENCAAASAEIMITTPRWGNVNGDLVSSAMDIAAVVDKVKDAAGAVAEYRAMLQGATPNPLGSAVSAMDIARSVDSVKGLAYPFTISACP